MASTYSTSLQLQLIGAGEQSGVWGSTTNTNLNLIEQAVTGVASITMSNASYTLSVLNGTSDEARCAVLVVGGTNSAIRQVIAPLVPKTYLVVNNTAGGYAITVGGSSGTLATVPNGTATMVYCDGTNFAAGMTGAAGNFSVAGNETVGGNATITGTYIANGFQISNSSGDYILTPVVANNDVVISGISSNDIVDYFVKTDYRGVEYLVTVDDNTANNRYLSKILITHNNTDPLMVEYGSLTTNSDIGNFAAYSNSTHISLNFNSLVSNATVRYARVIV